MVGRNILLIFLFLLGLSGCYQEKPIVSPAPTSSLTAEVEPPIPAPTSTPTPVPEPTPGIAEQFRAVEGKDLYLWGGSLSESREFLDNSGYLKLKEPRQPVDTYSRSYGGNICVEVFRDEWNMTDVALLTDETGLCQEIPLVSERHSAGIGGMTVADADFDGEDDILLHIGGERGGHIYYAAFLREEVQFRYEPSFSEIPAPKFDAEHQVIWGGSDFNFGHYYYAYELLDGRYTMTHYLAAEYRPEIPPTCTEYALQNGSLTEVFQWEFPNAGEEPDWINLVDVLEAYIDAGTIWEGWAWCDPRAYERFG